MQISYVRRSVASVLAAISIVALVSLAASGRPSCSIRSVESDGWDEPGARGRRRDVDARWPCARDGASTLPARQPLQRSATALTAPSSCWRPGWRRHGRITHPHSYRMGACSSPVASVLTESRCRRLKSTTQLPTRGRLVDPQHRARRTCRDITRRRTHCHYRRRRSRDCCRFDRGTTRNPALFTLGGFHRRANGSRRRAVERWHDPHHQVASTARRCWPPRRFTTHQRTTRRGPGARERAGWAFGNHAALGQGARRRRRRSGR